MSAPDGLVAVVPPAASAYRRFTLKVLAYQVKTAVSLSYRSEALPQFPGPSMMVPAAGAW